MEHEIYLDNSATTRVDEDVVNLIATCMREEYGNPASLHEKGIEAEKRIRTAREAIAETLKVDGKTIVFTSGGTESNNYALFGTAYARIRDGKHIISTPVEHPSVKNVLKALEEQGFLVTYVPVDRNGLVDPEDVVRAMREDTTLVSVMYVNNEIGAVEPIEEIGRAIHEKKRDVTFHVDAIQAYGKYAIAPKKSQIDLLSVSSHKIGGPKGVGFLYVGENVKIRPLILGGGQQRAMRSGTENVPGVAGFGLAAEKMYKNLEQNRAHLFALKQQLVDGLLTIEGAHINGKYDKDSAPHIVSCSFENVRSEVLLHALGAKKIYVSSGSACSSDHPSKIGTLAAIGLPESAQEGTIRLSLGIENTAEEIDIVIRELKNLLPVLRRFVRR